MGPATALKERAPGLGGDNHASHPMKALEEDYENRVVTQARLAGARLPE
jgi:hypothetical protein